MKNSAYKLLAGIAAFVFLVGCAKTPDSSLDATTSAESDAETKEEKLPLYDSTTRDNAEIETALVSCYSGTASLSNGHINYEIAMIYHRPQTPGECMYEIKLDYCFPDADRDCQTLSYWADTCDWPESIEQGPMVSDYNGDGYDDFLIELGITGKRRTSACFVYDPKEEQYVIVSGFSSLHTPTYRSEKGWFEAEVPLYDLSDIDIAYILGEQLYGNGAVSYHIGGTAKYCIDGEDLVLTGRLMAIYLGEGEGYRYTEEQLIDGEMVMIHQNVREEEIDFSNW